MRTATTHAARPVEVAGAPLGVRVLTVAATPEAVRDARHAVDVLDRAERATADSFVQTADRDLYLVAHLALRRLLGERLGVTAAGVMIDRAPCSGCGGPHGRPVIPGGALHFSLSHTVVAGRGLAVVALAHSPVGVDAEGQTFPWTPDLLTALHPSERAVVDALPAAQRQRAFLECWVRKEAWLKATGQGLTVDPDAVLVGLGPRYGDPTPAPRGWRITALDLPHGVPGAVAVRA